MTDLGYIGVGNMGGPMVRNLLADGLKVTVHDVNREAVKPLEELGATWADTPKAVAEASDVVMTSLPGPPEVEAVALGPSGIIEGVKRDAIYADLSSISPSLARKMHGAFKEKGAHVMDCPVSGGIVGATNRKMVIMIGGDKAIFYRCKPTLDHLGDKIIFTGEIGAGSVCKLVHNAMSTAARCVVTEGFTLGVKAGVDPMSLWRAVRWGVFGRASAMAGLEDDLFAGKFDPPSFALKLAYKDIALAVDLAKEVRVPVNLISLAEQWLLEGMGRGWGDRDSSSADILQEERARVEVRIPNFQPE